LGSKTGNYIPSPAEMHLESRGLLSTRLISNSSQFGGTDLGQLL
jgi:hypothetical protein